MFCSSLGDLLLLFISTLFPKSFFRATLSIVYFHLHCSVIFTPNEITRKSPKVLTEAAGVKSQSSAGLV